MQLRLSVLVLNMLIMALCIWFRLFLKLRRKQNKVTCNITFFLAMEHLTRH